MCLSKDYPVLCACLRKNSLDRHRNSAGEGVESSRETEIRERRAFTKDISAAALAHEISASLQVVRVAAYQNVQNCCTFRAAVRSILRAAMDITSRTFGAIVQPSALSAPAPPCSPTLK